MPKNLFDLSEEYHSMLNQGLRLTGESAEYFLRGRLAEVVRFVPQSAKVNSVLDFGCGIGIASPYLKESFPGAQITGVDTVPSALSYARTKNTDPCFRYLLVEELEADATTYDLCYVNGVFHHIPLELRKQALELICGKITRDGLLCYFENNPWNIGTRIVMARIPFDRDAHTLNIYESIRLIESAGFSINYSTSLFFFPRMLGFLRVWEPLLGRTRLGAQYGIFASPMQ